MEQGLQTERGNHSPGLMKLAKWLRERRKENHLSLRQAGAKADLSHVTIAEVERGRRPSIETLRKLARTFSGNGHHEQAATEDMLLTFCGYRTSQKEVEFSEPLARLMDKIEEFTPEQLELMDRFADFIAAVEDGVRVTEVNRS